MLARRAAGAARWRAPLLLLHGIRPNPAAAARQLAAAADRGAHLHVRCVGQHRLAALGGGAGHGGGWLGGCAAHAAAATGLRPQDGGGLQLGSSPWRTVSSEAGGGSGLGGVPYSAAELAAEEYRRGLVRRENTFTSQYNGVSWHTRDSNWRAHLWHGGKQEQLGDFATEEAAKVRRDARCLELGLDPDKRKTSGFRGVGWHKPQGKWQARISVDRKLENLGYFEPTPAGEVGAALAYDARARAVGRPKKANFEPVDAPPLPGATG